VTELRINGRSDDGLSLNLLDADGKEFTVRINETLRSIINQQRLAVVPEADEPVISIAEIQRRLRAGESVEALSRENNISLEKIERFSGPILQERIYIIDQAQQIAIRKESGRDPVGLLGVVISRLAPRNIDSAQLEWNTWRHEDGTWTLELHYPNSSGRGQAQWNFDPTRRTINSLDENARWMMGDEAPVRTTPEHGLVHTEAPYPVRSLEPVEPLRETPRLAVIREEPDDEAIKDGITARAKVPSWDEIMFGIKKDDE
jgi:hypothetical protein